ncbi:MAG: hypothetical protein IJQ96_02100 [Bacteroidales bacterium]|nr:hypothetical protein [Bacteroidales bacterium]
MRKRTLFALFAAVVAAGIVGISCTGFDVELPEKIQEEHPQQKEGVYTLTLKAYKGAPTKALTEATDGKTIQSIWETSDVVKVYRGSDFLGELRPATSGSASTDLTGNLTTAPSVGDVLTLTFCSKDYASQNGTLEYIAAHCDYAMATVTVTVVSGNAITTTPASFESRQAIVKFTLKKTEGGTELAATQFMFNDGSVTYTVTPSPAASTLYVAIPAFSDKTITLSAQAADGYYDFTRSGVSFEDGKYYRVTVSLTKQLISSLTISGLDPTPTYDFGGVSVTTAL